MRGWTRRLLAAIEESPGLRSGDLAERLGDEQVRLKRRVRRLKDPALPKALASATGCLHEDRQLPNASWAASTQR
jgi:hypothetical protein